MTFTMIDFFEPNLITDDNGKTIEQMYISYDRGKLTLHASKDFTVPLNLSDEEWEVMRTDLEEILANGTVYKDTCEKVFSMVLHSPYQASFNDNTLNMQMKLVGKGDREFYDNHTARKFSTYVTDRIIKLANNKA